MTLPNFFIAGAARCGSTSLEAYCRSHPQIYMSTIKEPNYFSYGCGGVKFSGPGRDRFYTTSIVDRLEYERLFARANDAPVVGEASINYMIHPEACAGIRALAPRAKIVFILRQPVERAWSSFHRSRLQGTEPESDFIAAWRDDSRRREAGHWVSLHRYKSLYGRHLQTWFNTFPRDQIMVLRFEDFKANTEQVMRSLFSFLGVSPDHAPDTSIVHNRSAEIENLFLRQLWDRSEYLRARLAPHLPLTWRGQFFRLIARGSASGKSQVKLPDELKMQLTEELKEDILELERLTGVDFSGWFSAG